MNLKKEHKVLSIHFTNVNILFHSISKYSIKLIYLFMLLQ